MSKYFFVNKSCVKNDVIEIKDKELLHLKVLRKGVSDIVNICDNSGKIFQCKIIDINKNSAFAQILKIKQSEQEINGELCLCFALSKADKMEFVIQKATEMGITKFIPFSSEFTTVKENTTRLDRLEIVAIEACKQCGGAKIPEIMPTQKIIDLPRVLHDYDKVLLAYEKAQKGLKNEQLGKKIALIVGSEGGFSEQETLFLQREIKNLKVISLGKRILRAETACVVLTALALNKMGEI